MNALDDSVSDDGQETYHLFTLDTHSVRPVSVQKGKKFFAAIKLSAAKNFLLGKLCNWILRQQPTHLQWMIFGTYVQQGLTSIA